MPAAPNKVYASLPVTCLFVKLLFKERFVRGTVMRFEHGNAAYTNVGGNVAGQFVLTTNDHIDRFSKQTLIKSTAELQGP